MSGCAGVSPSKSPAGAFTRAMCSLVWARSMIPSPTGSGSTQETFSSVWSFNRSTLRLTRAGFSGWPGDEYAVHRLSVMIFMRSFDQCGRHSKRGPVRWKDRKWVHEYPGGEPIRRVAEGRARHSVHAADSNPFAERRARSDVPYLTDIHRNFFVTVLVLWWAGSIGGIRRVPHVD